MVVETVEEDGHLRALRGGAPSRIDEGRTALVGPDVTAGQAHLSLSSPSVVEEVEDGRQER